MRLRMRVRPVRWYSRQGMILTVWSALAETMKLESAVMVSWLVWNSCSNVCLSSKVSASHIFIVLSRPALTRTRPMGEYETLRTPPKEG